MNLNKLLFFNIIWLFIFGSCDKEEYRTSVRAGIVNTNMLYHEYNTPLKVQFQTDSLIGMKYGTDSIDIDLDGNFDVQISQKICLGCDHSDINDDNFPYVGLVLKNDFDVAYKDVVVYTGLGTTYTIKMVDALLYETRIDKIDNWHNSNDTYYFSYENGQFWLWGDPPSPFWCYGPWNELVNSEMYIGIRKRIVTDYKLGWIRLMIYSKDDFEIIGYAIEE